jgi:hypothetical protein
MEIKGEYTQALADLKTLKDQMVEHAEKELKLHL